MEIYQEILVELGKLYRDLSSERIDEHDFISSIQSLVANEFGWDSPVIDFEAKNSEVEKWLEEWY